MKIFNSRNDKMKNLKINEYFFNYLLKIINFLCSIYFENIIFLFSIKNMKKKLENEAKINAQNI